MMHSSVCYLDVLTKYPSIRPLTYNQFICFKSKVCVKKKEINNKMTDWEKREGYKNTD